MSASTAHYWWSCEIPKPGLFHDENAKKSSNVLQILSSLSNELQHMTFFIQQITYNRKRETKQLLHQFSFNVPFLCVRIFCCVNRVYLMWLRNQIICRNLRLNAFEYGITVIVKKYYIKTIISNLTYPILHLLFYCKCYIAELYKLCNAEICNYQLYIFLSYFNIQK